MILLARIKVHMAENLNRLPDYTCVQTVERSQRKQPSGKFRLIDALRYEVALVDGKELFAWPGETNFQDKPLREFFGSGGAIGNGSFALHARSVFLGHAPQFTFRGDEPRGGRACKRFDYVVHLSSSGYRLRVDEREATVGYHGSFWADSSTLDLVRLEVDADDIPPLLQLTEARTAMEYSRQKIGDADFLLPSSSELVMVDIFGNESRNRTSFGGCRQYSGESVVTFAEPPPEITPAPTANPEPARLELPVGVQVDISLETPIHVGRSAIGDLIEARVARDVKRRGTVVLKKGTRLEGRITRLQDGLRLSDGRGVAAFALVGVKFLSIETEEARGEFRARLLTVGTIAYPRNPYSVVTARDIPSLIAVRPDELKGGSGLFLVKTDRLQLSDGLRMVWEVEHP
jgi:hypothetical protein